MASYGPFTFTTNTTTQLVTVHRKTSLRSWLATFVVSGTFGGGTFKLQISLDGGTTKVDLKDYSGANYSATADDNFNVELGGGNKLSDAPILYGVLSGATSPSITVRIIDNN